MNNRTKRILEMAQMQLTSDSVLSNSSSNYNYTSSGVSSPTFSTLQPMVPFDENQGFIRLNQSFQIKPITHCTSSDESTVETCVKFNERIELEESSNEVYSILNPASTDCEEILYVEQEPPAITEELLDRCQLYEIEGSNVSIEGIGNVEEIEGSGSPLVESDIIEEMSSSDRVNSGENQGNRDEHTNENQTKKKRNKNPVSVRERQNMKIKMLQEKHSVLEGCNPSTCKARCHTKISYDRRQDINKQFWDLNWLERRTFILNTTTRRDVKRRTTDSNTRQNTIKFSFKDENGLVQSVCKIFYLTTLGYKKSNDWIVHSVVTKTKTNKIQAGQDKRGKQESPYKISTTEISEHIESFHPCISHYRREHAPNRRYLPSDITITFMYKDFTEKYPNIKCSYELYRLQVKEKNISFTRLGHEECEMCEYFKLHDKEHTQSNLQPDCEVCERWSKHIEKAKKSRAAYKKDAEKVQEAGSLCVSADLQKVIMLPRLDTFKKVLFTKRIIAYHESFVPLGKKSSINPLAAVWHEAIAGRNKEHIVSTFYAFLKSHRDVSVITLWLDNCASQNKNWTLLSFLCYIINSTEVATKKNILKYFEPGHTFMSADSFHHQVEMSLKKQGKTYDFEDFVNAVKGSNNGKVEIKQMEHTDFYYWKDHSSQAKINKTVPRPYLADIVEIEAEKGSFCLKYRTSLQQDSESTTLDFLCKKMMKKKGGMKCPEHMAEPCGISTEKRDNILSNLRTIIPVSRKVFWTNIATSDE